MPRVRVHNFTVSLDGYGAGPDQTLDVPLGVGGEELHEWMFATAGWQTRIGNEGAGSHGVDDDFMEWGDENIGAHVMGRNMYGPVRGPWGDEMWRGWWGDDPPYHHDVFVLTHHAHEPVPMAGGTTFHFVTDGPDAALDRALEAAGGRDVRIGGGVATIKQYLRAGRIDDLHVAISPRLLGGGERLFDPDAGLDGYEIVEFVPTAGAAHVRFAPTGATPLERPRGGAG